MKLGLARIQLAIAIAAAGAAGCSASGSKGTAVSTLDGGAPGQDEQEAPEPPHALGIVTLGEMHTSAGATSAPIVSASFLPSTKAAAKCSTKLAGCEVPIVPKCGGTATASGCGAEEVCTL